MLQPVISTNLRMLKIWDGCVQCGEELPYGAYDLLPETLRIIYRARAELLRPCYKDLLDGSALKDVDRVERLLDTLMRQAPQLLEFIDERSPSNRRA